MGCSSSKSSHHGVSVAAPAAATPPNTSLDGQEAKGDDDPKASSSSSTRDAAPEVEADEEEEAAVAAASYITSRMYITDCCGDIKSYYALGEVLGQGTFGSVTKAKRITDTTSVAVKSIAKSRKENRALGVQSIKQEVDIMRALSHEHVINLLETFEDRFHVHIVMDFCTGGTLCDAIVDKTKFNEVESAHAMQQILSAVHYVHGCGVCHRDIKPDNLLLATKAPIDECCLKLADFGFSCQPSADTAMHAVVGTPYYVAPEVLQGRYDISCDLWSCGVILYLMLCGVLPFYGEDDSELHRQVLSGNYSFGDKLWNGVTDEARALVSVLLKLNPRQRFTAQRALNHLWIQQRGNCMLLRNGSDRHVTNIPDWDIADDPRSDRCVWWCAASAA